MSSSTTILADEIAQNNFYKECLQKQLTEIDSLSSIFCNPGELVIYGPNVIADFNEYLSGNLSNLQSELDFSVYLQVGLKDDSSVMTNNDVGIGGNGKIELRIQLPNLYPLLETATVTIRNSSISKMSEKHINDEVANYIETMDKNDTYIFEVILWIQDNLEKLLTEPTNTTSTNHSTNSNDNKSGDLKNEIQDFERLWIYSHHIKNQTKRQNIIKYAHELDLTGFSRPGKPGIICVEGLKSNTQEFWKTIKSMRWQKITIRKSELKQKSITELEKFRKFKIFREELFTDGGNPTNEEGEGEIVKMDMSQFMKFLENHNCGYVKKELFGFD